MPYAIIQRDNSLPDIVIQASSPELIHQLLLKQVELGTRTIPEWAPEDYEAGRGSFKVCEGIYIKKDDTDFSTYNKRGVAIWLNEKNIKDRITPTFELQYLIDRALSNNYLLGYKLYPCVRLSILKQLEEIEEHTDKIDWLIKVINDRYYNTNGSDYSGRFVESRDNVKPPYNFFEHFKK
jgi:hypothetical protein